MLFADDTAIVLWNNFEQLLHGVENGLTIKKQKNKMWSNKVKQNYDIWKLYRFCH